MMHDRRRPLLAAAFKHTVAGAIAFALGFVLVGPKIPASASTTSRSPIDVRFAPGMSSTTFNGKATRSAEDTYSLFAEAGQTMSIEVEPSGLADLSPVEVSVPGELAVRNREQMWSGTIAATGPIEIVLGGADASRQAEYSLTIGITGLASDRSFPRGIEQFDFSDGTVALYDRTYRLKNRTLAHVGSDDPDLGLKISRPVFGYVDGYANELALLFATSSDGGHQVDLYAMQSGKPVLVAALPGGDCAKGGFKSAKISDRHVVIEVFAPDRDGTAC